VKGDGIYSKTLYLDMEGGYSENYESSGIYLVFPHPYIIHSTTPRLEVCDYKNYVQTYNETLPNYARFVEETFNEMWNVIRNNGFDEDFQCRGGSAE
jgi:hypothetical protein